MANWVAGLIGILFITLFLGNYAVKLGSIALWVIIIAILAMAVVDFYQSTRQTNK